MVCTFKMRCPVSENAELPGNSVVQIIEKWNNKFLGSRVTKEIDDVTIVCICLASRPENIIPSLCQQKIEFIFYYRVVSLPPASIPGTHRL